MILFLKRDHLHLKHRIVDRSLSHGIFFGVVNSLCRLFCLNLFCHDKILKYLLLHIFSVFFPCNLLLKCLFELKGKDRNCFTLLTFSEYTGRYLPSRTTLLRNIHLATHIIES